MRPARRCAARSAVAAVLVAAACAPGRLVLPTGPGAPFPEFASAFADATRACRGVRTLTAELALSGRAGDAKIRGRVLAGLASPDSVRLEGVALFGPPAFILAARPGAATLVLPRDDRVLTGPATAAIVEALAGVALGAEDLRAVLTGCVVPEPDAEKGRAYGDDWVAVDLRGGASVFLRTVDGRRRVVAGVRGPLTIEYREFTGDTPRQVRLRSHGGSGTVTADLTVGLSQVEINVPLDPSAFTVRVPEGALPLTLDELRRAGPLGVRAGR